MVIARQLYELQEIDIEIESHEQALHQKESLLGKNQVVVNAQNRLAAEQQKLDELKHELHAAEWVTDDLDSKIKSVEEQLYGGKITNPKELSSLQQEVNMFKAHRDQAETRALEIMDNVEKAEAGVANARSGLQGIESEWQAQQQQLSVEINRLHNILSDLKGNREKMLPTIEPQAVQSYEKLRKLKGQAVARVEQGICHACRISLPSSELQQVRGSNLVQCGSCGRILFLP